MKTRLLLLLLALTPLIRAADLEGLKKELISADTAFCDQAGRDGAAKAFLARIADDGLLLDLGKSVRGSEAVRQLYDGFPAGAILTWKPTLADVAASGDLGYTTGSYELRLLGKDGGEARVSTGNYVTIWKRQADGTWKFVLDGGSLNPPKKS